MILSWSVSRAIRAAALAIFRSRKEPATLNATLVRPVGRLLMAKALSYNRYTAVTIVLAASCHRNLIG